MAEVIDRLVAAMNEHDIDAAACLMHEDYRSEQPAHPRRAFVGRAQMHADWKAMIAGIPDFARNCVGRFVRVTRSGAGVGRVLVMTGSRSQCAG